MLDDYVQGRLPPEQHADFESYMMDKPALLEQAELALTMREGFVAIESSEAPPQDSVDRPPTASVVQGPFVQWQLAAVAAFVAVGVGSLIGLSIDRESGMLASQIVNVPITRSDMAQSVDATIRGDTRLVVLRIPLPDPESIAYRVTITDETGPVVDPLLAQPDGGGVLNVAVDPALIPAGSYSIEIAHSGGDADVTRIALNVADES